MKYIFPLFALALFFVEQSTAQNSNSLKRIRFKITVTISDSSKKTGWLAGINDSALQISHAPLLFPGTAIFNPELPTVYYNQVSGIVIKRKNAVGRGLVLGAISGLVIGAAAGLIAGDDPHTPSTDLLGIRLTAGAKAVLYSISGAGLLGGVGAVVGSLLKKTFHINGSREKFIDMRTSVMDRAYGEGVR